jgi:exodeoxyribonuclease VII small subunit
MNDELSLEEALRALDEIVRQLESGEGTLDQIVTLFEKGEQLLKRCQQELDAKELRIQQILGDDRLAPFDR